MSNIETLIIKQIFKNPNGSAGKTIEYSGEELTCSILRDKVINAKYAGLVSGGKEAGIVPNFKRTEENLPGEEWREHTSTKLLISNLGRVKTPDGKLQDQEDKDGMLGYLQLTNWKGIQNDGSFSFAKLKLEYVYQLVAETWLEKDEEGQKEFGNDRWEVHHITNNGYDNRPENLIWLKQRLHQAIHALKPKC